MTGSFPKRAPSMQQLFPSCDILGAVVASSEKPHTVIVWYATCADSTLSERSRLLQMVDAKSIAELVENGGTLSPRASRRLTKKSGLQVVDLFEYVIALVVCPLSYQAFSRSYVFSLFPFLFFQCLCLKAGRPRTRTTDHGPETDTRGKPLWGSIGPPWRCVCNTATRMGMGDEQQSQLVSSVKAAPSLSLLRFS